ncbi:MAG: hypothetical protein ACREMY_18555, partial [bacterium]
MRIRLQVLEERCAKCGKPVRTFHQSPHDYAIAVFVSSQGRVAVAVADEDPVWEEAKTLLDAASDRLRSDRETANCFPHLFNRTVDEIDGDRFYMWGEVPCPQ